jgi:protein-tyrosine-phosphatase
MPKILFVCGSNRSRGPLAAAIFKKLAADAGLAGLEVDSVGLRCNPRQMICPEVGQILADEGISPLQLGVKQVLAKNIKAADLVICFTSDQQEQLESTFPSARKKTKTIMSIINSDSEVFDPAKGGKEKFRQCLNLMRPALETLAQRLR